MFLYNALASYRASIRSLHYADRNMSDQLPTVLLAEAPGVLHH